MFAIIWNHFQECVKLYVQLTGYSKEFRQVSTPFLPEDQNDAIVSQPAKPLSKAGKVVDCPWCRFSFDPSGSPSLPNPSIASMDVGTSGVTPAGPTPAPSGRGRSASNHTPHPPSGSSSGDSPATKQELGPRDQDNTEQHKNGERQLHIIAANILMTIMYGARFARPDLLRAVCVLARRITKWDDDCDKRLLRLVAYINSTLHYWFKGVDRRPTREVRAALLLGRRFRRMLTDAEVDYRSIRRDLRT